MPRKKRTIERDTIGNVSTNVPRGAGGGHLRVSYVRKFYEPPLDENGEVDLQEAARQLEEDVAGGTLWFQSCFENHDLQFPAQITIESKADLEAVIRAMRRVFQEGVKASNEVREAALKRCRSELARRAGAERRTHSERRCECERREGDRRAVAEQAPEIERRAADRRRKSDRRKGDRRAA